MKRAVAERLMMMDSRNDNWLERWMDAEKDRKFKGTKRMYRLPFTMWGRAAAPGDTEAADDDVLVLGVAAAPTIGVQSRRLQYVQAVRRRRRALRADRTVEDPVAEAAIKHTLDQMDREEAAAGEVMMPEH